MTKTVEFFFDFGSPTTYLAYRQLPRILAETGAKLIWKPVLLGGIFQASGNVSPMNVPAKAAWMSRDMERWAEHYGVGFKMNPHYPINTLFLMRGATGMQRTDRFAASVEAIFTGLWQEGLNLGDTEILRDHLARHGIDFEALKTLAASDEVKLSLKNATEQAVERGVFGCPTFFVGEEMFFGQDRLLFVEKALKDS